MLHLNPKRRKEVFTLVLVFLGVLLASAAAVYLIGGRGGAPDRPTGPVPTVERQAEPATATPTPSPQATTGEGFLGEIFTPKSDATVEGPWSEVLPKLALRLFLAALLGAALAFRPRRRVHALKRNPYVAQTQILLAVVASALMLVVGDNAARAFGIFAAVSLVRFRTNIRDPKEITVLLISLALGLATGVGRWDLAMILTLFSLALLWVLEYREPEEVFRSMSLKIVTANVTSTHQALKKTLESHGFDSELRAVGKESKEATQGNIVYEIDISPTLTTDELSEEILSQDTENIISVEWEQKKSFSYPYQ